MPKLSDEALEKRFQCDYCGDTFRTRQGLSGHIQFKHQILNKPKSGSAPLGFVTKAMLSESAAKKKEITNEKITDEKITKKIDNRFIMSKQKDILTWRAINGLSKSTNDAIARLLISWGYIISFFNTLDIELTEQDFKTYLLEGLGNIFI